VAARSAFLAALPADNASRAVRRRRRPALSVLAAYVTAGGVLSCDGFALGSGAGTAGSTLGSGAVSVAGSFVVAGVGGTLGSGVVCVGSSGWAAAGVTLGTLGVGAGGMGTFSKPGGMRGVGGVLWLGFGGVAMLEKISASWCNVAS
jgi:hypothetical protein